MPCWKFRAFFKFWYFPILCWRVGTFQNSVHATKQLLHKASQCGSYFCTFRSQTLKFSFQKEKLRSFRLLSTVPLWKSPVAFIDVIIGICQDLATLSQSHEISKSLWMIMHMFCLCVYLCICLFLLVVYAKPPDQFLGRSEDSETTLQCFEIKTSLYSKIYFKVKFTLSKCRSDKVGYGAVAESQEKKFFLWSFWRLWQCRIYSTPSGRSLGNLDICCFWLFILKKKLSYSCYDKFQILNRWSLASLQSVL